MKKYEVKITDKALRDLEDIYDYIGNNLSEPITADKQCNRIIDEILKLETMPERYQLFISEPEHSRGIRKMTVDNYLVCYVISENIVVITNIFYGAADIESKLRSE